MFNPNHFFRNKTHDGQRYDPQMNSDTHKFFCVYHTHNPQKLSQLENFLVRNLHTIILYMACCVFVIFIATLLIRCHSLYKNKQCSCYENSSVNSNLTIDDKDSISVENSTLSSIVIEYWSKD